MQDADDHELPFDPVPLFPHGHARGDAALGGFRPDRSPAPVALLERDQELARLERMVSRARGGRGGLVLVTGEAGIGKTSLVRALRQRLSRAVPLIVSGCEPLSVPVPLMPVRDLMEAATADLAPLAGDDRPAVARSLLAALERRAPVVAVLEDLHWADPATIDIVRLLVRTIESTGVVLLATYRDDELGAHRDLSMLVGDLATNPAVRRLALARLSASAVQALAEPAGLDASRLLSVTGGNPFLVVESVAAGGRLPHSVRDATTARAARLGPHARAVLDAAAVIGQRVPLAVLRAVAPATDGAIEECLSAGALVDAGGATVAFRHELTRQAVEESISPARRARLHERVIEALEASGQAVEHARVAHHAEQAGARGIALRHATLAAREAERLGVHADAARQYERALAQRPANPRQRGELLVGFGRVGWLAGRVEEAMLALREAVAIGQGLADPSLQGRAVRWLHRPLWELDRWQEARQACLDAIALLERTDHADELAHAWGELISLDACGLNPPRAVADSGKALEQADQAGLGEVRIDVELSQVLARCLQGEADGADVLADCRARAQAAGWHWQAIKCYAVACMVAAVNRAHEQIDELVPEALAFYEERQALPARDVVLGCVARSLLDRGRLEEAIAWTAKARRGTNLELSMAPVVAAVARLRRGEVEGDRLLAEVRAALTGVSDMYRLPMLHAALAEAAWLRGDGDALRAHVRAGLAVRGVEQVPRAAGELALWALRCGEPLPSLPRQPHPVRLELAGNWRAAVRAWRGQDAPYEAALAALPGDAAAGREAVATLHRLGARAAARAFARERAARGAPAPRGPRPSTRMNPAGLTLREREILLRMAAGATNREIARTLHLSERTVAHHVSAVLRKLQAPTRTAAAEAARGLGMLSAAGANPSI
jgi:DNA-binding CsgD family transcriptional regulator/tetratricopeptide (TPR) repeat protein